MDKFLIFGLERSGTTSLISALNVNNNVVHEPFSSETGDVEASPAFAKVLASRGYLPSQLEEEPGDFSFNRFHFIARDAALCDDYLEALFKEFTGIKHVWNTVSMEANHNILNWCLAHDIKLVFQHRESLGRVVVSRHLADQAKVWSLGHELEKIAQVEAVEYQPINIKRLKSEMDWIGHQLDSYRAYLEGESYFDLSFEALYLQDREQQEALVSKLCTFLSAQVTETHPQNLENYIFQKARRQTTDKVLESVPNYRKFKKYL